MITIDKDLPLPPKKTRKAKYPFSKMDIGDSFMVDDVKKNTVLSAAQSWAKRHSPKAQFTIRSTNDSIRIWRVK